VNRRAWVIVGVALAVIVVGAVALWLLLSTRAGRAAAVAPIVATIVEAINQVDAHPRSADDWQPAVVDMALYGGGQVRTGAESRARLEMPEGMVRLAADTVFTVKESVTRGGRAQTTVSLQEGRLWVNLTAGQSHEFTVEAGGAVAAVRDTRFSVQVSAGETLVSVVEGQVELTAQEQSVTVAAGQQATVQAEQPPAPPEPLSDQERALWATEGEMPEMAPPTFTPDLSKTPAKSSGQPTSLHHIGGFLNLDAVDGENWPASTSVSIRVFSAPGGTLLFNGTASTNEAGHFYMDVGTDLVPGMAVEVTDGAFTKDVTLVPLTVDAINPATGTVSGTALAGSEVTVRSGTWFQSVTANDKGVWTANSRGSLDTMRERIQVEAPDGDGDRTVVKI
jgi:FecR protein